MRDPRKSVGKHPGESPGREGGSGWGWRRIRGRHSLRPVDGAWPGSWDDRGGSGFCELSLDGEASPCFPTTVAAGLAQNWLALLGSHCSSRTMEGSLLAPLMNSSSDSLPIGQ